MPETRVFAPSTLATWGKHPVSLGSMSVALWSLISMNQLGTRFDAPLCASVSLRLMIVSLLCPPLHFTTTDWYRVQTNFQLRLASARGCEFDVAMRPIQHALSNWRTKWIAETQCSLPHCQSYMMLTDSHDSLEGIRCHCSILPVRPRLDYTPQNLVHGSRDQGRSGSSVRHHGVSSVLRINRPL